MLLHNEEIHFSTDLKSNLKIFIHKNRSNILIIVHTFRQINESNLKNLRRMVMCTQFMFNCDVYNFVKKNTCKIVFKQTCALYFRMIIMMVKPYFCTFQM